MELVNRVKKLRKRRPKQPEKQHQEPARPDTGKYTPLWAPGQPDYDPTLPFGPHIYVARKSAPDSWWVFALEVFVLVTAASLFAYAW